MNERILKLAEQAGSTHKQNLGVYQFYTDELEKFVELIVQECIGQVENLSPGYQDYRNQIEDAFRRDCVEQLKQHFGVE